MKIYIASSWKNQHGVEMLTALLDITHHSLPLISEDSLPVISVQSLPVRGLPGVTLRRKVYHFVKGFVDSIFSRLCVVIKYGQQSDHNATNSQYYSTT
jgi:hypothetical protein